MLKKLLTVLAIVAICGVFMAGSAIAAPTIEKGQSFDTYLAELGATQMTTTELAVVQGEAVPFIVYYLATQIIIRGGAYACNTAAAFAINPVWQIVKRQISGDIQDQIYNYIKQRFNW